MLRRVQHVPFGVPFNQALCFIPFVKVSSLLQWFWRSRTCENVNGRYKTTDEKIFLGDPFRLYAETGYDVTRSVLNNDPSGKGSNSMTVTYFRLSTGAPFIKIGLHFRPLQRRSRQSSSFVKLFSCNILCFFVFFHQTMGISSVTLLSWTKNTVDKSAIIHYLNSQKNVPIYRDLEVTNISIHHSSSKLIVDK